MPFSGLSIRCDSCPITSVALVVGSNLYYSAASPVCAVLRLAIAYPIYTVHFPCCSSEFNARSSLLVSYRVASPPFRSYSYRRPTIPQPFASSRVHSLPSRFISFQDASMSLLFCSKPFPAVQCLRQSFRVAAMPLPVSSSPSAPFMAIPLLVASVRFSAVPSRLFWILCHSVPSRFNSSRRPSSPCPCETCQSYAMPYPIGDLCLVSPPCLAVSNHLRYSQRRAVSLLLYSPLSKADQIRCRSCPGAYSYSQRCRIKS